MTESITRRFLIRAAAVALAAGVVVVGFANVFDSMSLRYAMFGWGLMALVGVGSGAWAVSQHGTSGSGFIVALGTGMLTRLVLAVAGAVVTVIRGDDGIYAYFAGVGAGYIPVQVFEMGWFLKRSRVQT